MNVNGLDALIRFFMPAILDLLEKVHGLVHNLVHDNSYQSTIQTEQIRMKKRYSEPKIYTGGVSYENIKSLTSDQKDLLLRKQWYVYYSFRDQKSGRLVRMPNIKASANQFDTISERYQFAKNC